MPQSAGIWTESFDVHSYEVNPRGEAALQTLCNYFQEAAGNHARAIGVSRAAMLERGTAWVLARLRLQVDRYPTWRDTVEIRTWPSGLDRLYATREFVIHDTNQHILARGTSAWLVIDVERRRPTRPPADLHDLETPDREQPVALSDDLPDLDATEHERRFQVRFSDLDLNEHVNNVRYVEWALEAVPEDVLSHHRPSEIELHFQAETRYGDTIVTQARRLDAADDMRFLHAVRQASSDRIAARARTRWTSA